MYIYMHMAKRDIVTMRMPIVYMLNMGYNLGLNIG
jgi:hypothetical protein